MPLICRSCGSETEKLYDRNTVKVCKSCLEEDNDTRYDRLLRQFKAEQAMKKT